MDAQRRFAVGTLLFATIALAHALSTWPPRSTATLFLGGVAIAFVAEAVVVRLGLLEHHVRPRLAGVPVVVVLVWPATVYAYYRTAALVVPPGAPTAAAAATVATAVDLLLDPIGVRRGLWTYPEARPSRPRVRGVPWWNAAGWWGIVLVTAMLVVRYG